MTPSTPLPEQGGFNERLDEILDNFLDGTEARLTEIGWERYGENVAEAKAAIRTLVLEEIIGEDVDVDKMRSWEDGHRRVGENHLRFTQRQRLEDTHGTK